MKIANYSFILMNFFFWNSSSTKVKRSIFEFSTRDIRGNNVPLESYRGRASAFLIVNVACECGLTSTNYKELQILQERFGNRGLQILAFPCNNFGGQEPGSNEQIEQFATGKGATFQLMSKIDCGTSDTSDPLFRMLQEQDGGNFLFGNKITWNFAKFLCDKDGYLKSSYLPITSPLSIEKDIVQLLPA